VQLRKDYPQQVVLQQDWLCQRDSTIHQSGIEKAAHVVEPGCPEAKPKEKLGAAVDAAGAAAAAAAVGALGMLKNLSQHRLMSDISKVTDLVVAVAGVPKESPVAGLGTADSIAAGAVAAGFGAPKLKEEVPVVAGAPKSPVAGLGAAAASDFSAVSALVD
jgi:hypothetical protein